MKIKLIEEWEDEINDRYCELRISTGEACCVQCKEDGIHIWKCDDGNEVYSYIAGADFSLRKLTKDEDKEIVKFAESVFLRSM